MRILPPDAETPRQSAFSESLDKVIGAYGQYDAAQKNKAATKRQQAMQNMNTALSLQKQGYDVSPEQIGEQFATDDRTTLQKMFGDDPAAKPDISSLLANRTDAYTQGKEREAADLEQARESKGLDLQMKKAKFADMGKKFKDTQKGQEVAYKEGIKAQGAADKKAKGMRELNAVGYTLPENSDFVPSKVEAKEFRNATGEADAFSQNIGKVESIIRENEGVPSGTLSPNVHSAMEQAITNAKLDLKGPAFFKLGVLAGPDMELIDKAFGEIDSLRNTWQPGNMKIALQKLQQVKDYVNNKVRAKAGSLGYVKNEEAGQVPQMPGQGGGLPGVNDAFAANPIEHPQANAAVQWAQQNRNDPRAMEILSRMGAK